MADANNRQLAYTFSGEKRPGAITPSLFTWPDDLCIVYACLVMLMKILYRYSMRVCFIYRYIPHTIVKDNEDYHV